MEILNNAVSKAKEAWGVVSKKTGEAVSVGKQKFDISSLEVKLKKEYEKLGKLYFGMIKDTEPNNEKVAEIVAAIKEKKAEIKERKAKLNEARNKRICPQCGAAIEEDSVYCNFCGAELIFETTTEE